MDWVNLSAKLAAFDDHWSPKIVAGFNGHDVMVVKVKEEFVSHAHADTYDLFLVLSGRLMIRMREGDVHLGPRPGNGLDTRRPRYSTLSHHGFQKGLPAEHTARLPGGSQHLGDRCTKEFLTVNP